MERKIGEIFEYNGEWYQCLESPTCNCKHCDFYDNKHDLCHISPQKCLYRERSDKKDVIFKKLEKVGEPYSCNYYGDNRLIMMQEYNLYNLDDVTNEDKIPMYITDYKHKRIAIEIKQNKEEDMKESKVKLSQEEYEHVKNLIENHILPGKLHKEVYEDEVTEQIMRLFSVDANYSNSESIGKILRPFDLQKAKEGKPVCTRDGRKARIICFDRRVNRPVVALIESDNHEEALQCYFDNGRCCCDVTSGYDLMMLPEKKEGWVNVYKKEQNRYVKGIFPSREIALNSISEKSREYIATIKITWEE